MKKRIPFSISYFVFLLSSIMLLSSCEVFRKTPEKSTASRPGKRSTLMSRRPVARTNTTKPTAASRKPVPASRPSYSRSSAAVSPRDIPQVVQVARTYTGVPYRSGGNDKDGIDCSGLICSVYSEIGVKVPRISWQQSEFGREIGKLEDIRAGDWLFFVPETGKEGYVSHAGIVTDVRNLQEIIFIHASTSRGVREDNLFSSYFKGRFVKAMRPF
ncbi:C40 family peptidase [Dyadobacter arcticus]|uniref:Cell wall-associated NlpC family hydrolase n=1 Tax=Dyadobacter arcticus TaxID=1078754 RepID=A0ABX0UKI5_9BACT|nr:C40 family peptidase [Dyadobacter arcticus]NIJ53509.1 cell wall-associated NlpC family hydrolase [Dyadobacter arcticus]